MESGSLSLGGLKGTPYKSLGISGNPEEGDLVFGRFVLTSILGKGRSTTAWLATDPRFRREVVLKFFQSSKTGEKNIESQYWRDLVRQLRILNHPNIALGIEVFAEDPWIAISNQYIPGKTLAVYAFETKTLNSVQSQNVLKAVGNALVAAHGKDGITHGNLNCWNILLTDNEKNPKITDFGLIPKLPDWANDPNAAYKIACASPLQRAGGTSSIAEDIYAFAVVAFQLFTGANPPLDADQNLDVAAASNSLKVAPEQWRTTLLTNLSREITQRSGSMESLLRDLNLLEAVAIVEPAIPKRMHHASNSKKNKNKPRGSRRKRRRQAMMSFFIFICTVSLPLIIGWMIYQGMQSNHAMELERTKEDQAMREAEILRKEKLAEIEARLGQVNDSFSLNLKQSATSNALDGERTSPTPVVAPPAITKPKPKPFVINSGAQSLFNEGRAKMEAGNPELALESYGMAMVLQSDWVDLREARAVAMLANNQPKEAIAEFSVALKLDPNRLTSRLGRARAYLASGNKEDAKRDLQDLLTKQPDHAEALAEMEKLTPPPL